MKSFYDFQGQINAMGRIFKQQVSNAQKINSYLQKMPQTMVTKLANQLRQEYQNLYNDSQDQQKLNSIKQTLNLASGERATNLDSLFIELAEEINTYYKKQYFSIKKQIPFTLQCDICRKYVANDRYTCELHKSKCWKMKQRKSIAAPQRKNVKKKADTKEKYQDRQKLVMETVNQANLQKITWAKQSSEQGIITQKKTISKSKAIKSKKQVKNAKDTSNIIATQFKNKFLTKTKDIQQQQQQSIIENQLSNYFNQEEELFLQMLHKNNRDKDIHTGNFLADFSKNAQGEGLNKFVEDAIPEMNNQFLEE